MLNCFPEQLPTRESPSAFIFYLNIPLVIEHSHLDLNKKKELKAWSIHRYGFSQYFSVVAEGR